MRFAPVWSALEAEAQEELMDTRLLFLLAVQCFSAVF